MKFLSIQHLVQKAKAAFLRFPFTILSALLAVCIGLYLVEYGEEINNFYPFINTILCASLGIPLYFCASIFAERNNFDAVKKGLFTLLVTAIVLSVYFTFPSSEFKFLNSQSYIRFIIYNIIAHLLVSFAPYLRKGEMNGFWQYNYSLFIRFCTAIVYSGFLFLGLVFALLAVDTLFDISIDEKNYARIFIIVGGLFNTWFFVSGIPKNFTELEETTTYPRELKFFAQYILLPLLGVYLLILYAYGSKIILSWNWPKGIVSYLIICVSVLGIFTFLLMHPYGKIKENDWIGKFSKVYYYLLVPLTAILFIAISMRISDYGITVNRYIILALGVWLLITAIYQIFRSEDIKFIPISLCIILLLMAFGPWSMFSVSERSQVNRLKQILTEKGILINNKISNEVIWEVEKLPDLKAENKGGNDNLLDIEEKEEIYSILEYLEFYHDFELLNPLFQQDIATLFAPKKDSKKRYTNYANIYNQTLGFTTTYRTNIVYQYYNLNSDNTALKNVSGYDYLLNFTFYTNRKSKHFEIEQTAYFLSFDENEQILFGNSDEAIPFYPLEIATTIFEEKGTENHSKLPQNQMTLTGETKEFFVKIVFKSFELKERNKKFKVQRLTGDLFLKRK